MGSLTALQRLLLTSNNLTTLPGSFTHLVNLQVLSLAYNRLCNLPSALHAWADKYNPGWESAQDCQTDAGMGRIIPVIRASGGPRMTYDLRGRPAPFGAKSKANAPPAIYLVKEPDHRGIIARMVVGK
jgi:Leucine-rich repeat (LRR) protein